MSAAELLLVTPDLPVERGERKSHLDDKTSLIRSELQTNCRCIISWSRSQREPGFVRQLDATFMWIVEWLGVQRSVASFYTSMTFKLVRLPHPLWLRWHSAAPPSLHPRLQLFSPFFFFLCSARCYFCCLFRSHFPPVAARPSMHPFSNPSEHPVWRVYNPGQDSYFLSSDTNSSKKHVLREGIRLSTWIFFSPFLYIFLRQAFNCGTFGVMFNHGQLASPFSCVHRACMRAYKKTI